MAGRSSRGWLLLAFCSGWLLLPATVLHAGAKEDCLAAWEKARALETKADYPAAAREYELALAPRVFGPDAENTATILNNLAELYRIMGQISASGAVLPAQPQDPRSEAGTGPPQCRRGPSYTCESL